MKLRIILTGATGMVGEGVLHECLENEDVESVLIIGRRTAGISHPKVKEIVHPALYDLSSIESQLEGYNACLFCLGTSSVGKKEPSFTKITYELTIGFAKTLSKQNLKLVFCYISGAGTDSTEKGRLMWARVKGKTENDLMKLPFKAVYNFRPGILSPTKGLKNTLGFYKWLGWMIPLVKAISPKSISSLKQLGRAMIAVCKNGYEKNIIEVSDIKKLSV